MLLSEAKEATIVTVGERDLIHAEHTSLERSWRGHKRQEKGEGRGSWEGGERKPQEEEKIDLANLKGRTQTKQGKRPTKEMIEEEK